MNKLIPFYKFKLMHGIPKLNPGTHDRIGSVMVANGYKFLGSRYAPNSSFKDAARKYCVEENITDTEIVYNGMMNLHVRNNKPYIVSFYKKTDEVMIHPCTCIHYNGGQCYNCLNGAHDICDARFGCKKPNSKHLGLRITIKN